MLSPGTVLDGKYRIIKVIGAGGMSVVYLAVHDRVNRFWAVKEVRKIQGKDGETVSEPLITEAGILKKITHPLLPRIIDIIDTSDCSYLIMDYIRGISMEQVIKDDGVQPEEKVRIWAGQLCEVLSYLHSREPPIIYRDMKPSNIMVKPDGTIMLIDFGTAREWKESGEKDTVSLGTRGYAAPEQYAGRGQTDERTDIYCLGITLYHMLTGHNPAEPPFDVIPIRQWDPGLSEGMEHIIAKCTRKDPRDRYQSCEEIMDDLNQFHILERRLMTVRSGRLKFFLAVTAITVFFACSTCFCGLYYHHLIRQRYKGSIEQAVQAGQVSELRKNIEDAIVLDRGNPDAYVAMLSWVTSDHKFTEEEKTALEAVLYSRESGIPNIAAFRRHKKRYALFAYDMGAAFFFYYKGSRGKSMAKIWFESPECSYLKQEKKTRAAIYARIGTYYPGLNQGGRTGENISNDYQAYFEDLAALNEYSPDSLDNQQTAITLYSEIARQIGENAGHFLEKEGGVSLNRLNAQITKIEHYMRSFDKHTTGTQAYLGLRRNILFAKNEIKAAAENTDKSKAP